MQLDIEPYNELAFKYEFIGSKIHRSLSKDFDEIHFSHHMPTSVYGSSMTPRELFGRSRFSAVSFYYLNKLITDADIPTYDIGYNQVNFFVS